jgi:hypothetical protein
MESQNSRIPPQTNEQKAVLKPTPQTYRVAGEGRSGHSRAPQLLVHLWGRYANPYQAQQIILCERAAKNSLGHSVRSPTKGER